MQRRQKDPIRRKNIRKVVRSIFEEIILIGLVLLLIRAIFTFDTYEPYDENKIEMAEQEDDTGFIALSYFGVDRNETKTLISTKRLQEHIDALSRSGYVTITQQDILDYYCEGKALPKKALFLMFEDGRRDTAIFAQNVTEKYNYISTIMTYAGKFETKDSKFLMPKDLLDLKEGTFCELGTNGYRLEYINVFDRYDNFLGNMNTLEFAHVQPYLDRNYDHYLMDYVRDEYGIPRESHEKMKARIEYDYDELARVYREELGEVPQLYVLMHSNTGQFGENDKVSAVNQACIFEMFRMNFNREGNSLNTRESSLYDLTRLQPQAYWHSNHLLMRIWDDTKQEPAWVDGDLERKSNWEEIDGKAEFQEDAIFLTCEPKKTGTLRLKESGDYQDVIVNTKLTGNKLGAQSIYLRADEKLEKYLCVKIENNKLIIRENPGKLLYRGDLDEITQAEEISVEEDKKAALIAEKELEVQYAETVEAGQKAVAELSDLNDMSVESVKDGAEEYVAPIHLNDAGEWELHIELKGDRLSVLVNECVAVSDLKVGITGPGYLYVQSGWGGEAYSQRNLSDDVYDGVFESFEVTKNTGAKEEEVLYDNKLHGWEWVGHQAVGLWEKILNWFITTF